MVALVAAIVRLAVDDSGALTALQFALAVIFLTYVVLLLDVAAAAPSPGAVDNASGVAAMLEAARRLAADAPGAGRDVGRVHRGGRRRITRHARWLEAHGGSLRGVPTYFVNVKGAGNGRVCHVVGEGYATLVRNDERLARLAERAGSERHVWRIGTDASAAAVPGSCGDHAHVPGRPGPDRALAPALRHAGERRSRCASSGRRIRSSASCG